MSRGIDNGQDIIDSRDVIKRIEELESNRSDLVTALADATEARDTAPTSAGQDDEEILLTLSDAVRDAAKELADWDEDYDAEELKALKALADEGEASSSWSDGEALIRDSYFQEYAEQFADDIGAIDRNATWPCNCIDWEKAAEQLQMDYTSVNFDGETYWIRS